MAEQYRKVNPKEYAQKLKEQYARHPQKWYAAISPKSAADRLRQETNDDFSKIWHEHCSECWANIDATTEEGYVSGDGFTWLCKECFLKLNRK